MSTRLHPAPPHHTPPPHTSPHTSYETPPGNPQAAKQGELTLSCLKDYTTATAEEQLLIPSPETGNPGPDPSTEPPPHTTCLLRAHPRRQPMSRSHPRRATQVPIPEPEARPQELPPQAHESDGAC